MVRRLMAFLSAMAGRAPVPVKHRATPEDERKAFDRKLAQQKYRLKALDARIDVDRATYR